jgi:hypothetical protein
MAAISGHSFNIGPYGKNVYIFFPLKPVKQTNSIGLVVSDEKIFTISANENTLWTLAAMLDFKSAPKTQIW